VAATPRSLTGRAVAPDTRWCTAPAAPEVGHEEVDLWTLRFDPDAAPPASIVALLDTDERRQARSFLLDADRNRQIRARATLRAILARYLGMAPQGLTFTRGPRGRPRLSPHGHGAPLYFSVSHAADTVLFAVSRIEAVGVDVEAYPPPPDAGHLVTRFFSPAEQTEYRAVPTAQRDFAFLLGWTRKEAVVKATGAGMALPFDAFDVTLSPGLPARITRFPGQPDAATRWTLIDVPVARDRVGALAVRGGVARLRMFSAVDVLIG
jgi:4'-phosphopantetheinyl transferase